MKRFLFVVFSCCWIAVLNGQSVGQLWADLNHRYQSLNNYVDAGEMTQIVYSESGTQKSTYLYELAMDSMWNVYHAIAGTNSTTTWNYTYRLAHGDAYGILYRNYANAQTQAIRSLPEACASLHGVGKGVLSNVCSLMFPGLYRSLGDTSQFTIRYDTIFRLVDTLIGTESCYVLQTTSDFYVTEEEIQYRELQMDSMLQAMDIPTELTMTPRRHESPYAGQHHVRYYIRKRDGLLCRRDLFSDKNGIPTSYAIQKMSPKVNVENFDQYLHIE